MKNWAEAALVAREVTLRKVANEALESHHASTEADASTSPPEKSQKQVTLPRSGTGERCKHCSNPGHIASLCPRKAAQRSVSIARTGAARNLCVAVLAVAQGQGKRQRHV